MARGGKRPGAGRPRKGAAVSAKEAARLAKGGELPLDYMLRVMRNPEVDPARRDAMAKAAAPFLHAKTAAPLAKTPEPRTPAPNSPWADLDADDETTGPH